ncbi:MAG: 50S ribosomal protein L21e [Candidatus Woesearchaeota archaeon]|jgi:ribosomal protein L21E
MTTRHGGSRYRTRSTFRKNIKGHGKISTTRYFQILKKGDKVLLKLEPAVQKGLYHARFHGYPAIVLAKQGKCYVVQISDQGKKKDLVVHPVHLKKGQ